MWIVRQVRSAFLNAPHGDANSAYTLADVTLAALDRST